MAVRRALRAALGASAAAPVRRSGGRVVPVAIDQIREQERLRSLDPEAVEQLKASIEQQGQQSPVQLRPFAEPDPSDLLKWGPETPGLYMLITGSHRLEALRRLGRTHVEAFIRNPATPAEARLIEIDENLVRADLTVLDRAAFLAARKEAYEVLHKGARRSGDRIRVLPQAAPSFSAAAVADTGLARRTVQRAVQIHHGLTPEVRRRLAGTPLADNEGALYKLSRLPGDQQSAVADRHLMPESEAGRKRKRKDGFERLSAAWKGATRTERRRFLAVLGAEPRVIDRLM